MADDNDDSWLYGGGPDDGTREDPGQQGENSEDAPAVKNGTAEIKNFENTFDEHNFEVRSWHFPSSHLTDHHPSNRKPETTNIWSQKTPKTALKTEGKSTSFRYRPATNFQRF